jgi:hypothetical protein
MLTVSSDRGEVPIMPRGVILASSVVLALLVVGPASANPRSPEHSCVNAVLDAVGHYQRCLIRAYKRSGERSHGAAEGCTQRFDRAFELAKADGSCRIPGGAAALRIRVEADLRAIVESLEAATSCADLVITDESAVCLVSKSTSTFDFAPLIGELSGFGVNDSTTVWIQAWGGNGSRGNVESHAGAGGVGGYAQMTTSLRAFFEGLPDDRVSLLPGPKRVFRPRVGR